MRNPNWKGRDKIHYLEMTWIYIYVCLYYIYTYICKICMCYTIYAVLRLVAQSCPTLCNPMDCSPPGSSDDGDSPGKNTGVDCHVLLQWIFPRDQTQVSHIARGFFTSKPPRKPKNTRLGIPSPKDLPEPGIELESLTLQVDSLSAELPGKPI